MPGEEPDAAMDGLVELSLDRVLGNAQPLRDFTLGEVLEFA